jgi:protein SCO1
MKWAATVLALLALAFGVVACDRKSTKTSVWLDPEPAPAISGLDVAHHVPFALNQEHGRLVLLSFGYTSCLELCPDTFAQVHRVFAALGAASERVAFAYVTVDPDRDKPEPFSAFMAKVDPRFDGIYLDGSALTDVLASYHVSVRKRLPDPARYARRNLDPSAFYAMDHSSGFWLIDAQGKLRVRYQHDAPDMEIVSGIRELLTERG